MARWISSSCSVDASARLVSWWCASPSTLAALPGAGAASAAWPAMMPSSGSLSKKSGSSSCASLKKSSGAPPPTDALGASCSASTPCAALSTPLAVAAACAAAAAAASCAAISASKPSLRSSSRLPSTSNSRLRKAHVSASSAAGSASPSALPLQYACRVGFSPPAMACSNCSDRCTRSCSVTTCEMLMTDWSRCTTCPEPSVACTLWLLKVTSLPPKPKVAPMGRRIHCGALRSGTVSPVDWWVTVKSAFTVSVTLASVHECRLFTATCPSKDAVEKTPGTLGHHCTSKFQLLLVGSSHRMSALCTSQQMVRLSLALDSSRVGSWCDHAMLSTPFVWPTNSLRGDTLLRRSHICSVGDLSSSDATTSCVATSGFHCRADARRVLLGSLKLITGFCLFRSQTTVVPLAEEDARMCCTLQFQEMYVISLPPVPGAEAPFRAGYSDGVVGLARSQMQRSLSPAPDASRLGLNVLKSRPLTAPVCFCILANRG
mmetsp:Transcript_14619/g.36386  ORF Transcript_14619/g.36386 Transcript_14619/m.36386 type:complete len:490 (-) Transcript_14619:471-1940(-)